MIRRVGWVVVSLWLGVGNLIERRHGRKTRTYNADPKHRHGAVSTRYAEGGYIPGTRSEGVMIRLSPQDATPAEWEARRRPQDAP